MVPVEPGVRGVPEYQFKGDASTGPVVLDLLVVFSPGMVREGQSSIERVVADTNEIFRDSGTSVSFRVVGVRVVASTDEETIRLMEAVEQSTLDTWSEPSSKLLRRVTEHPGFDSVRKEVGADIVVTWTDGIRRSETIAGKAWRPSERYHFNRSSGFSNIHSPMDDGRLPALLAHELGHNLSLAHQPEASNYSTPYVNYGHGYEGRRGGSVYGTVMATGVRVWLSRFSDNDYYGDYRIGDSRHRAVDAIDLTAGWVADYEESKTTPPPGGDDDDDDDDEDGDGYLQNDRFFARLTAWTGDGRVAGRRADWGSTKGILFWAFDAQNPEAMVKVLDGRTTNGNWWLDAAVTSDLITATTVRHQESGKAWIVYTGRARDLYRDSTEERLVYCAFPDDYEERQCQVWGWGTTLSLRDAWNRYGAIPSRYYQDRSSAAAGQELLAPRLRSDFHRPQVPGVR